MLPPSDQHWQLMACLQGYYNEQTDKRFHSYNINENEFILFFKWLRSDRHVGKGQIHAVDMYEGGQYPGRALPLLGLVGMCRGFDPLFQHLEDLGRSKRPPFSGGSAPWKGGSFRSTQIFQMLKRGVKTAAHPYQPSKRECPPRAYHLTLGDRNVATGVILLANFFMCYGILFSLRSLQYAYIVLIICKISNLHLIQWY